MGVPSTLVHRYISGVLTSCAWASSQTNTPRMTSPHRIDIDLAHHWREMTGSASQVLQGILLMWTTRGKHHSEAEAS